MDVAWVDFVADTQVVSICHHPDLLGVNFRGPEVSTELLMSEETRAEIH